MVDSLNFHLKSYGFRAFAVSAPVSALELWNKLPNDIRSLTI